MSHSSPSQQSSDGTKARYITHANYNRPHRLGRFHSIDSSHVQKYTPSEDLSLDAGAERGRNKVVWLNDDTKHILNPAGKSWSDTEFETFRNCTGRYRKFDKPRYANFDDHTAGKDLKRYVAIDNAREFAGRPLRREENTRDFTSGQSSVRDGEPSNVEPLSVGQPVSARSDKQIIFQYGGGPGQDGDGESKQRKKKKKKNKGRKKKSVANGQGGRDPGEQSTASLQNLSTVAETNDDRVRRQPVFNDRRLGDVDWAALGAKRNCITNRQ